MIVELLLTPIFIVIQALLDFLPKMPAVSDFLSSGIEWISRGLIIFPLPVWIASIVSIIFWSFGGIGWSFIEWIYKKIPGID